MGIPCCQYVTSFWSGLIWDEPVRQNSEITWETWTIREAADKINKWENELLSGEIKIIEQSEVILK